MQSVTIDWFLYDKSFSERCFRTDFKSAFVFSPLQQTHDLT